MPSLKVIAEVGSLHLYLNPSALTIKQIRDEGARPDQRAISRHPRKVLSRVSTAADGTNQIHTFQVYRPAYLVGLDRLAGSVCLTSIDLIGAVSSRLTLQASFKERFEVSLYILGGGGLMRLVSFTRVQAHSSDALQEVCWALLNIVLSRLVRYWFDPWVGAVCLNLNAPWPHFTCFRFNRLA